MFIEDSVKVVIMWESEVLFAHNFFRGQRFVLGETEGAWPFPGELLGARSRTLVDYVSKVPRWCPTGESLTLGHRFATDIGSFRILAQLEPAEPQQRPSLALKGTQQNIAYHAASALVASLILGLAAYTEPELTDTIPVLAASELTFSPVRFCSVTVADAELDEPGPEPASEVRTSPYTLTGYSPQGNNSKMGTRRDAGAYRYGVLGPKDNPDPHISRPSLGGDDPFMTDSIGFTRTWEFADLSAPVHPSGRDVSLGTDTSSARGHLAGEAIADAAGFELQDLTHRDGGEAKLIVPERAALRQPARAIHTQLHAEGPLSPSDIERSLISSLPEVRDCYRQDISSRGLAEGQLKVTLTIDGRGNPTVSSTGEAVNVSAKTVACVLERFEHAQFPTASSVTTVVYPLLFVPERID